MKKNKKGKLIVMEGTDGSGKATQTKLLIAKFKKQGVKVKTIDFPHYTNFFGKMVGRYLTGEFGSAKNVDPYLGSVLYAADRFEEKERISSWINNGYNVVIDRYISSNQIHQGGKIGDNKIRKSFFDWVEEMEFEIFKIPKPDIIIYLDMPLEISLEMLKNKSASKKKRYLGEKKDIHESDIKHLQDARKSADDLIKRSNKWVRVCCAKGDENLSRQEISNVIWDIVKERFNFAK